MEEGDGDETCPSCGMPFDKGKKRKLIDSCGHERCYACMFRNEGCPLCASAAAAEDGPPKGIIYLILIIFFSRYILLLYVIDYCPYFTSYLNDNAARRRVFFCNGDIVNSQYMTNKMFKFLIGAFFL